MIDAVGIPETWKQAFYGRDLAGTVVLVGVPTPEMRLELPLLDVFGRGGSLKSSWYGDCLPSRDFPMLIDLYLQGRLPLDAFVTETIGIGDVEAAFDKMHGGDVLRSVVVAVTDVRIDHGVTSGTFSLDGETFDVDNNVWVVGNDDECLVIDAPHDVEGILEVIDGRRVLAIVCTHAHDDHVRVAPELAEVVDAPILLHPDDAPVWQLTHPDLEPDGPLDGRQADRRRRHRARRCCTRRATRRVPSALLRRSSAWSSPATRCSTADPGRPGGASPTTTTIVESIRAKLFTLPDDTVVHTGHGDSTTIEAEADALGR